jgi:hypothetical protein
MKDIFPTFAPQPMPTLAGKGKSLLQDYAAHPLITDPSSDHTRDPTCLSNLPHVKISDPLAHYFGCLAFSRRDRFLAELELEGDEAERASAQAIRRNLKRIQLLRYTVRLSARDHLEIDPVKQLEESRAKCGLLSRSQGTGIHNDPPWQEAYDVEKDVKGNMMVFEADHQALSYHCVDLPSAEGHFPNQQVALSNLLTNKSFSSESIFGNHSYRSRDKLLHIHVPANNMKVGVSTLPLSPALLTICVFLQWAEVRHPKPVRNGYRCSLVSNHVRRTCSP